MNQCHHCGFVLTEVKDKIVNCPRCNWPLAAASISERPALDNLANAWWEMRSKAGFDKRIQQKPWDRTKQ